MVIENLSERSILGMFTPRTVVAETLEFGADPESCWLAFLVQVSHARRQTFSHHLIIGSISGQLFRFLRVGSPSPAFLCSQHDHTADNVTLATAPRFIPF
jgi:hypothetical protein